MCCLRSVLKWGWRFVTDQSHYISKRRLCDWIIFSFVYMRMNRCEVHKFEFIGSWYFDACHFRVLQPMRCVRRWSFFYLFNVSLSFRHINVLVLQTISSAAWSTKINKFFFMLCLFTCKRSCLSTNYSSLWSAICQNWLKKVLVHFVVVFFTALNSELSFHPRLQTTIYPPI